MLLRFALSFISIPSIVPTCIPPNGSVLFRIARAIYSSLSKSSPSTIETKQGLSLLVLCTGCLLSKELEQVLLSSMMRTFVLRQRSTCFFLSLILFTNTSAFSFPNPMPAKLQCQLRPSVPK
ncbi:hypothetical protein BX666DRAFT_1497037 [Dichotomocladium elegans]|nr:hypothetical protein BX666DRAFT_1497037 [Dichotomocladium elegans]